MQALIVFVAFSLVRTKLPHYTMPAFPCIALWLALQIARENNPFAWFGKRFAAMVVLILVLMLGGAAVFKNYLLTENLWRAVQPHSARGNQGRLFWLYRIKPRLEIPQCHHQHGHAG